MLCRGQGVVIADQNDIGGAQLRLQMRGLYRAVVTAESFKKIAQILALAKRIAAAQLTLQAEHGMALAGEAAARAQNGNASHGSVTGGVRRLLFFPVSLFAGLLPGHLRERLPYF